jgi:hypothetical protein
MAELSKPSASRRLSKLQRSVICVMALEVGKPMVTHTVLERYRNEMAGAMWAGSMTA